MNTKFDVGQRVTYPVVHTADGNITGIAISKAGVTRYAIGPKWYTEDDLKLSIEGKPEMGNPVTEPVKESKPEPVKLYCVKSFTDILSAGKIYESDKFGHITYDDGRKSGYPISDRKFDFVTIGNLVPLVRRPAKVGEYIIVEKMNGPAKCDRRYDLRDILEVTKDDSNIIDQWKGRAVAFKNITHPDRPWQMCVILNDEYLVLDGYTGDPDEA